MSQEAMREGETRTWTCDLGLALAAIPIRTMERSLGALVAVGGPGQQPSGTGGQSLELSPADLVGAQREGDEDQPGKEAVVSPLEAQAAPPPPRGSGLLRKISFLEDLAHLVSDQMYMFSEVNGLSRELASRYEELNLLYAVTGRLVQFENIRRTLAFILEQVRRTVAADAGALAVFDRRILETSVQPGPVGSPSWLGPKTWHRFAQALRKRLSETGERYFLGTPWELHSDQPVFPQPAQILAVGFPEEGPLNGFVALVRWNTSRNYRGGDLRLLQSLARQVVMTVANADLYENLKDFLMATVKSLVNAIEAKDRYTSGHSERVHILSMLLGKAMGLDEKTLDVLKWASILHDVGKIGMPECILQKPGRLTPEEYEIVKEHPERGYQVLSPIQQLAEASLGVRAHHEMVDGNGYPQGLAGEEIPLVARIIAVADTYDALTSTRPYRKAQSIQAAMAEIRRVRGTQLDPEVVDALEKLIPFLEENQIMIQAASRAA
jgi:HD-GYP domain-containing protein (c-di-GMP phosphodiesterase class II)